MIWIVITVALGLALGVGVVLVLARPDSLRTSYKRGARRKTPSLKPVAPPLQVGHSQDKPPEVHRPVRFPARVRNNAVSSKPVAPPLQVGHSQDRPPEVDRPVDFPVEVLQAAWRRQAGLCANCGRLLIWAHRDRDSGTGAWHSHHRIPRDQGGSSDLKNCVLLCSGIANCHFNVGHGGVGRNHYSPLEDSGLLYLRHGGEGAKTTVPHKRTMPSLIREVFGVRAPAQAKKHSTSKPNGSRSSPPLPLQDDFSETC